LALLSYGCYQTIEVSFHPILHERGFDGSGIELDDDLAFSQLPLDFVRTTTAIVKVAKRLADCGQWL
jgi:hypothetical protein